MGSEQDFAFVAPGATGYQIDHPAAAHCQILDREMGLIDLAGRTKIAICGFASSSRGRIPFDDPAWIIAGLNQLYRHIPRADVWYDIHGYWEEDNVPGTDHPRWIRECGIPVYMAEPYRDSPTTVRYPIERLIAKHGLDYFTSTVSFMIAWALECIDRAVEARASIGLASHGEYTAWSVHQHVRSLYAEYAVGIFGIDLIVGTEYDWQKACVEFWLGELESRGIAVYIPPESALLKHQYRYGYEREPNTGLVKLSELKQRYAELDETKKNLFAKMHGLQGGLETLRAVKGSLNGESPEPLIQKERELEPILQRTIAELQTYDGAQQECAHMATVLELRLRGGQIPLLEKGA